MSDKKPTQSGPQSGTPAAKAKTNGTTPTVTARRPISKDEYARTTKSTPDATSVIPAVRDDAPAPAPKQSRPPEVDDRPTQTFQAVRDTDAAPPKSTPQPAQKKPEAEKPAAGNPESKKPTKPTSKKASATKDTVTPAAAGGVAAAAAAAAPAPAAPPVTTPSTPKPEQKKPEQKKPEQKKPESKKPELKRPEPKTSSAKAAPVGETKPGVSAAADSGRSARLKLSHIEPWSVTKMAFVVSVALMIVSVVAVTVFWVVLQITGVWGALNDSISNVLADDAAAFDITEFLGFGRVVGVTLLISSLNVIFMTALATIAAHLYNLASSILGGIELTFGERK